MIRILTNDPSVTAWGWAVIEMNPAGNPRKIQVVEVGCISTQPQHKKLRLRVSDDDTRRYGEIVYGLKTVIDRHHVQFITSEAPHGSQSSKAAKAFGAVAALLQTVSILTGIPVEWYSEGDAKKFLSGGRANLTKKETIKLVSDYYTVPWAGIGYRDEAVADALAVFHVALGTSPALRMFYSGAVKNPSPLKRTK